MLNSILNGRLRCLLLLPILFLVSGCFYFRFVDNTILNLLFERKQTEISHLINTLAAGAEAAPDRPAKEIELSLKGSVTFVDALPLVWGGAYKRTTDGLKLISARDYATELDPLGYKDFVDAVENSVVGTVTIYFTPTDSTPARNVHFYYRWTPIHAPSESRYLIVAGVSRLSMEFPEMNWMLVGQATILFVTFIINISMILLLIHLGNIYVSRSGSTKWRNTDA